ncbi:MAG: hypothetical protein AVDCRST_MAG42-2559, partial [uncultured Chthoniobacterales bacterium]
WWVRITTGRTHRKSRSARPPFRQTTTANRPSWRRCGRLRIPRSCAAPAIRPASPWSRSTPCS